MPIWNDDYDPAADAPRRAFAWLGGWSPASEPEFGYPLSADPAENYLGYDACAEDYVGEYLHSEQCLGGEYESAYPGVWRPDASEYDFATDVGSYGVVPTEQGAAPSQARFFTRVPRHGDRPRPPAPSKPLKMVLIGPNFQIGGVRQHALSLARFLDPQRIRITAFVATDPLPKGTISARGLPAPLLYGDQATIDRLARECDILLMWGGGFSQRLLQTPPLRVYVAHGESGWTRSGLEETAHVIDHVIAVSDRVRRSVCRGFPTTTILNGVDTSRLTTTCDRDEFRRRFAFGPRDFVLGSVGRFTREKRQDLLIEAVALLPERFKLLLVGSGRRRGELCEFANRRIPGRFAIVTAHDFLGDHYGAMDAFALVSEQEGFGLVLAEAMLCGRPVLATNVGCVPEVLCDRVSGVVVQPQPQAIADAAAAVQAHPAWARGMAAQGRSFAAAHLQAGRMAREYEDLLLRLVAQRRAAAQRTSTPGSGARP